MNERKTGIFQHDINLPPSSRESTSDLELRLVHLERSTYHNFLQPQLHFHFNAHLQVSPPLSQSCLAKQEDVLPLPHPGLWEHQQDLHQHPNAHQLQLNPALPPQLPRPQLQQQLHNQVRRLRRAQDSSGKWLQPLRKYLLPVAKRTTLLPPHHAHLRESKKEERG